VDVRKLCREAFKNLNDRLCQAKLLLPKKIALLWCDRSEMQQVVSNLISNAVKHYNPGEKCLFIRVSYNRTENTTELIFSDNGKGMDEAQVCRIFDFSFTTGNNGTSGSGMAITRKIVEAHGGTIEARCRRDCRGMEFIIRMPLEI
jgi:signal transduction histidine kinase